MRTLQTHILLCMTTFTAMFACLGYGDYLTRRPDYAGVWVNTFGNVFDLTAYTNCIAGEAGRPRWSNMEPSQGVFDFSELDTVLTRARNNGYYYYGSFWTGPHAPDWIYTSGVPLVVTDNGDFPYYLDADYKTYVTNYFDALADYMARLPEDKRARIAFFQPAFGSTGDRQLYKGMPVDPQYNISSDQYAAFMQEMTTAFLDAFHAHPETREIRFLWNADDYNGSDTNELTGVSDRLRGEMLYAGWLRQNHNVQFRKQQFTIAIGYMANNEQDQDDDQRADFYGYGTPLRHDGNPEFVRGEHNDTKWAETPMARQALKWHYYWTAVSSVDRGLDAWETKPDYILTGNYNEAFGFSTRHSFQKKPGKATHAFIALRDVLDYSDSVRFPAGTYGSVNKDNTARINAILAEFAACGATNEDTVAVTTKTGNVYLLDSTGLNDCVWNVIDRNYRRHITQYDPNGTSKGLWRVGSTNEPYGRFARSFEHAAGKNAMYFMCDDDLFADPAEEVALKVIYYDQIAGSTWALQYDAGTNGFATALSVTCVGDSSWKTVSVTLTNAVMAHNGPNGSDLALVNTDSLDDVFHMIELERSPRPTPYENWADDFRLPGGPDNDDDDDGLINLYEFGLDGNPTNSASLGRIPSFGINGDAVEYIHAKRTGDSGLRYFLETTEYLISNDWKNSGYMIAGTGSLTNGFNALTNRIDTTGKNRQFIRLVIEEN
ncbi:MAG: hypothetical protein K9M45_12995 [Kiritimatiellales bacterium]|nr:hypothetical protein [Kiritimatiellales bacterium]